MIKYVYKIGEDLIEKFAAAKKASMSGEVLLALLYSENESNKEILTGIKKLRQLNNQDWAEASQMLSTESIELALLNTDNRTYIKNRLSIYNIYYKEVVKSGSKKEKLNTVAGLFYLYRKIHSLKKISILFSKKKGVESAFNTTARIDNLLEELDNLLKEIYPLVKQDVELKKNKIELFYDSFLRFFGKY